MDDSPAKLVVEQITAATHELMSTEDWATNLSVSQAINAHPIMYHTISYPLYHYIIYINALLMMDDE
jgi:hypothetical protein